MISFSNILAVLCLAQSTNAFTTTTTTTRAFATTSSLFATVEDTATGDADSSLTSKGLLKRDRYIVTNRFAVRPSKGPKFEARWANRKSRLAELDGFKYFHLMRRVKLNDDTEDKIATYDEGDAKDGSNMGNYASFTIWDKKSDFSAWRKGEAFKEAHGGTSIGAFMSTMISSALILKGPPRPAFYDGLLTQSIPPNAEDIPETVDGWRNVQADGKEILPSECFVACNQFFVPAENAQEFELRWKNRESKLKDCEGFVAFSMMRRDAGGKGHGVVPMDENSEPTYTSTTIWKDKASFDQWRSGNAFKKAHGGAKPPSDQKKDDSASDAKPPKPLWSRPPEGVFYEGTLVISQSDGA